MAHQVQMKYQNQSTYNVKLESALALALIESIVRELSNRYPKSAELMAYNSEGTLELLLATRTVKAMAFNKSFNMPPSSGNDNYKAWEEYKAAVDAYLYTVNSDPELKDARKKFAENIKSKHYDRYPEWPEVGKTQSSYIELDIYNTYDLECWTIVWSCDGYLKVTDSRPESRRYIANFEGISNIRLLKLDHDRLNQIERLAYSDFTEAKKQVDTLKKLTQDDFLY